MGIAPRPAALASLVVSSLLGGFFVAAAQPASATTAPLSTIKQAAQADTARPDLVSAQLTARVSGQRVLVTGLSTPTSSTWANPDGTLTEDASDEPVQAKDTDGAWKPLDETLQQRSNGTVAPALSAVGTEFGAAGSASAARLVSAAGSTGLDWLSGLPAPTISGATATYPNVFAGADLTTTATSTGFELSLVARTKPPSLPPTLSLPLRGTGLTWALSSAGLLTGADGSGKVVVTSSGAQVYDASTDPVTGLHTHAAPLTLALTGTAGAQKLVVTVPTDFLNDPSTVYPVTIDPSASWSKSAWAYVDAAVPTTVYYNTSNTGRVAAWDAAGTHKSRSFYTFTTTGLTGKHILSASFKISESSAQDCTARPFEVWSTTPLTSTTTWNNQPSFGTRYATITSNAGGGTACPAAQVSGDVTTWAQNVLAGGYTSATLGIKAPTNNEQDQSYFKQFGVVTVSVTYNSYPSSLSQLAVSPCAAGCPATGTRYVGSSRPTFASYATDADGGQIAHYFSIQSASNPGVDLMIGHSTATGNGSISWQVPSTSPLTDGDYTYKAWAFDGTDNGPVTAATAFTVDATAPTAPTISSSTHAVGQWTPGTDFSFSLVPTASDTLYYSYKLDTANYGPWSAGTSATLHGVADNTLHTLSVLAMDRAGNLSPAATYTFGVGTGGLTSPADQDRTQRSVTLSASGPAGYPDVAYQWRRGSTASWTGIPMADVTGATTSNWPVGSIANSYAWNLANTAGGVDGLIQVRACLYTSTADSSPVCQSTPVDVALATAAFGDSYATTQVGPGTLAELTGNFDINATDVNIASYNGSLSIGRSFTTLATPAEGSGATGVFGPGWSASLPGPAVGAAARTVDDQSSNGYIDLVGSDGSVSTFEASSTPGLYLGVADTAASGSQLQKTDPTTIVLTELDGTQTTWTFDGTAWTAQSVKDASGQSTSFSYDASDRVTRILAPVPNGVSCTDPHTAGCRSLKLTYGPVTVAGSTLTRLLTVTFEAVDPQTGALASVAVASYDYDASGRLAHAWDPRITPNLKTSYTYDATGRLATITPPGLATWTLNYDASHRIASVTRPDPSGATATTTVAYGVPATTANNAVPPVDFSAAATWGQTSDLPLTGTAVFGPDHVPAAVPTSSDWPYASISYLDVNGREVNTASYGAGQWLVDTTRYDDHGNTVWSLTAGNRAQALSPTADTDPAAAAAGSTAGTANLLASTSVYNADGSELLDSFGPMHPVRLDNGTTIDARSHTNTVYDEGAPTTGGPYQLPTTVTSTVVDVDGNPYDARVVKTGYDVINTGDPNEKSGWELHQATKTTTQLGATADPSGDLVRITRYNASGQVVESRLPNAAAGGTAGDTVTSYYTAGSSGICISNALAGLACSSGPATQPSTSNPLPVKTTTYNLYAEPLTFTETAGSTVRTTTTSYDAAGRNTGSAVTVTPTAAGGTALPAVTTAYDSATGLPTTVSAGGQTLTTAYDNLGRVASYTDAGGNVATTTYDVSGRAQTVNDGKGTTTYTYDSPTTEHRGVVTSEDLGVGSAPGTMSATYDASGAAAAVTYPNGLVATTSYDNAGNETSLTYAMAGTTWMSFTQTPGSDGNTAAQSSPASSQVFSYDGAGRLTQTQDSVPDPVAGTVSCTTRVYSLGADSNRLSLSSYPDAGTDSNTGACSTATTAVTWSGGYDQADRITNTGYSYDTLGRTLTVPVADAVGIGSHASTSGDLSLGYYANDFAASQSQGGRTVGFSLDPMQNRVVDMTDSAAATVTNHYADAGDSPAWTSTSSGWTRNLIGLAGLGGTVDQSGTVTLDLANMHGDVVATCADDPAATGIAGYGESTEFGAPRVPSAAPDTYGWLGAKQRSADDLGGLLIMGIRLYDPATGVFLSIDPMLGGNDNPYVYVSDPIDKFDFNGMKSFGCSWWGHCHYNLNLWETQKLAYYGAVPATLLSRFGWPGILAAAGIAFWTGFAWDALDRHKCVTINWMDWDPFHQTWPGTHRC